MLKKIISLAFCAVWLIPVRGEYFKSQSYYDNRLNRPDFVNAELLYEEAISYIRQAEVYSDLGNDRLTTMAMQCVLGLQQAADGYKKGDKSMIHMGMHKFKRYSHEYDAAKAQWSDIGKAPCFRPLFYDKDMSRYFDKNVKRDKKRQYITPEITEPKVEGKDRRKDYRDEGKQFHFDRNQGDEVRADYLLKRAEFFEQKADYYKNQGKDNIADNYRKFAVRLRRRVGLAEKVDHY